MTKVIFKQGIIVIITSYPLKFIWCCLKI